MTGNVSRVPIFVDTNVLVAATAAASPFHQAAVRALSDLEAGASPVWVSRQVLREYLAVLSRPQTFAVALPMAHLAAEVGNLQQRFQVADENEHVTDRLLALLVEVGAGGKQVHDADIVATMLTFSIPRLLTANPTDFARYAHLVQVVPLGAESHAS